MHRTVGSSNFVKHLGHSLSQGDIDELIKTKWTYKWKSPAIDMPNCKWRGTGDLSLKECNHGTRYGLKPRLFDHWLKIYSASGATDFSSSTQRHFFSICNSYRDILHHNKKPFYLKGLEEDQRIADAYLMHSLNHILSTKDLINKNSEKLRKHQDGPSEDTLNNDGFLDQGFMHPKVLIILPFRSIAHRIVKRLMKLTPPKNKSKADHLEATVRGFARFEDKFGVNKDDDDQDNVQDLKSKRHSKPSDFQSLFGGNSDDNFMLSIKFPEKSIQFNKFEDSDMIIASPLGLITKIGEAEAMKEKNVDYLSSIEILIIDHADVILMQNWSHVDTVIKQLNRLPNKQHNTDIMRIRQWYLEGQARFYRQTIILSSHINPDIHATFNHQCVNYEGKMKLECDYKGVLSKLIPRVSQLYQRLDVDSFADADDVRFKYFTEKIFPQIKDSIHGGIMLFMSSYIEFIRLRNFLKAQDASFCLIGEYTEQGDISRARDWFFKGERKIMLYSERSHFYRRYKIRGIRNLIIYSLPERKEFYPEIVNMLEESQSCTVLYSRFDQLRLERIVGSAAARNMVASKKGLFVFEYE
ncbi:hypothetical protein Leryth_022522 [Lithospermum erythrorhizon]|nr:hypothetical protein Leryth_022522 [Lithospermum erythrorhizon]